MIPLLIHPLLTVFVIFLFFYSSSNISIKWLPAHHNNTPMDITDHLAKSAARETFPSVQEFTIHEASLVVEEWIWEDWRKDWASNTTCKYQSIFQLSRKYLKPLGSRRKDLIMSKFRLLQSKLN